jgi:anti-sigma factor RsiW
VKHPPSVDAARAALYALGALPAEQLAAFEERLATSAALRADVEALRATADELALAAAPVAPRPEARARLLARVRAEAGAAPPSPALPDLLFALRADESWIQVCPGIERRDLSRATGGASYLLRVAAGSTIPDHQHRRVEHSYVLSGSIEVAGTLCHAGDYHRAAAGTQHVAPRSADGCVMLVVEATA